MNYIYAVLPSRTDTLNFARILNNYHISCSVISTPKGLGSSCSVAVKFFESNLNKVKKIISYERVRGYTFYLVKKGKYGSVSYTIIN